MPGGKLEDFEVWLVLREHEDANPERLTLHHERDNGRLCYLEHLLDVVTGLAV